MRPRSTHVKLGLLAVLTAVALFAAVFVLGLRHRAADIYYTYFNESVQGLDEGAIVKFRGVRIGKVRAIRVAPDHKLIEVALAIDRKSASALQLFTSAPQLRTQLVIFGITGVKLVDIDFADDQTPPPPSLAFRPPQRYIASQTSLLGSVQDDLVSFVHRLPDLVDRTLIAVDSIDRLSKDARPLVADARSVADAVNRMTRSVARANVPAAFSKVLATLDETGKRAADATDQVEQTIRDVGDAARTLRDFVEALEREPDMIVKGRSTKGRR